MNENIDLTKILKNCPKGTNFYSAVHGDIEFISLIDLNKILFAYKDKRHYYDLVIRSDGKLFYNGECIIFPSKEQRDWSKFTAPWYKKTEWFNPWRKKDKKEKFDHKTLQPFDKVLIRRGSENYNVWFPDFVSGPPNNDNNKTLCMCVGDDIAMVIPYNNDTKHLVGTSDEAPEYYRYWED